MFILLLVVQCLNILLISCAKVSINNGTVELNLSGSEIDGNNLKSLKVEDIKNLVVVSYAEDDEQFDTIKNFPNLEFILISDIEQTVIPKFINIPKLKKINIVKTDINHFVKEPFADVTGTLYDLYAKNNKIKFIGKGSYGPKIRYASLSCNQLKSFNPNWFQKPETLEILNLRGNLIQEVQKDAFAKFTALRDINLSYNFIHTIGPGAFSNKIEFEWLFLHNNHLRQLHSNIFQDREIKIQAFLLQYNNLTFLPKKILENVKVVGQASIQGNPWQCACYDELIKWIPWKNYGSPHMPKDPEGQPRCIAPQSFSYACVENIEEELIVTFWKNTEIKSPTHEEFCSCGTKTDNCYRR